MQTLRRCSHLWWFSVASSLLSSACGSADGESPDRTGPLCSSCKGQLVAGGETSEFGGEMVYCADPQPEEVALDEVRHWVDLAQGSFELSLGWQELYLSPEVRGFEHHTQVTLDVEVTRALALNNCFGETVLETQIDVRAHDGSVVGSFPHLLRVRDAWLSSLEPWMLNPEQVPVPVSDLTTWQGTLDLALDPEREYAGAMLVELTFSEKGPRGRLRPTIEYREGERWTPLSANFPDDHCNLYQEPIELDADLSLLTDERGTSIAEYFARAQANIPQDPITATWKDGETTELSFELKAPVAACVGGGPLGSPSGLEIKAPFTVKTQDGHVQVSEEATIEYMIESGVVLDSMGYFKGPEVPRSHFDRLGVSGLDLGDASAAWLRAGFGVPQSRTDFWEGNLQVLRAGDGLDLATLTWCSGACEVEPKDP